MRCAFSIVCFCVSLTLSSQIYYRMECDVSIKEIDVEGKQHLMVGKVYFDKNIREIIYDIRFPSDSRFAISDYGMLTDSIDVEMDKAFTTYLVDFSVFNLLLNGQLKYFGLKNTAYQLVNASSENGMVISEWALPEEMGSDYGKMLISQKNNQLFGMVSLDVEGNVVSKQFFKDYKQVDGLNVPTQLIQINYRNGEESNKKITTFRNIIFNATDNASYRFDQ